jgi:histidine triad (HIT) family protein
MKRRKGKRMPQMCAFCSIARGNTESHIVFEDETTIAFLDRRPLFPGHCLVIPREHIETVVDLPFHLLAPFFSNVQLVAAAVERGMGADGCFVAINNRISQSVPHVHVHVVPRRRGDGLKGFFWPRHPYRDDEETKRVRDAIREVITRLRKEAGE